MTRWLNVESWSRRRHFHFFRHFEQPFFNLCAEVDVTDLLAGCRRPGGPSFFAAALHCSLRAINEIEEFHYRLEGDGVVIHDDVHGGTTVLMPNDTFAFAYLKWDEDFDRFTAATAAEIQRIRSGPPSFEPQSEETDLVHYTVIPWVSFTGFTHARRIDPTDSIPKIVFGRYHLVEGRFRMPVSVDVHHSLMDGLHVGRYFGRFEEYLAEAGSRWSEGGTES